MRGTWSNRPRVSGLAIGVVAAVALAALIENDVRPRQIITEGSVRNAARTMLAIGGSMNTIKHLQAVAIEAGLDVDVWEMYRELGRETPLLCSLTRSTCASRPVMASMWRTRSLTLVSVPLPTLITRWFTSGAVAAAARASTTSST